MEARVSLNRAILSANGLRLLRATTMAPPPTITSLLPLRTESAGKGFLATTGVLSIEEKLSEREYWAIGGLSGFICAEASAEKSRPATR